MAEIIENETVETMPTQTKSYASKGMAGTALGLSIAGTALGVLNGLGTGWLGSKMNGGSSSSSGTITPEEVYLERKLAADELAATTQRYEDKISSTRQLTEAFFDAYQRDVDNSFNLYKNQRDMFDTVNKEQHDNYDTLNQKIIDSSFGLYKSTRDNFDALTKEQHDNYDTLNQKIIDTSFNIYKNGRDEKDALNEKISALQSKVDVMAAVRPYQDALINCKIDKNAILADWHLDKRTCRMIEGQLVLPDNLVSGFTSYSPVSYN